MSWIADLAGKAESLLNNIDQSAAGAIKSGDTLSGLATPNESEKTELSAPNQQAVMQIDHTRKPEIQTTLKLNKKPSSSRLDSVAKQGRTKTSGSSKDKDAALFDFLNSKEKVSTPRAGKSTSGLSKSRSSTSVASSTGHSDNKRLNLSKPTQKVEQTPLHAPPPAAFHMSRSSSIDSVNSKNTAAKSSNDNASSSSEANEPFSEADMVQYPMDSTASESEFEMVSNAATNSRAPSERDSGEEMVADGSGRNQMRIENQMLQNEISALHQEMKSMSERNIRTKGEMEKRTNELQRKYDDLVQQFHVKNSQVEAMHIEVSDLDKENKTMKQTVRNLQAERERIIDDQAAGSGVHAQALDQRSRLEDSESSLIRERDFNRTLKEEALQEREKQESEVRKLAETLRKGERERQAEKRRLDDTLREVNVLQTSLASNKHELADYKQKAARILQSKERLISSLKGGSEADITASTSATIELEELRQERDSLKEDLMSSRAELVQLRNEFQDMEGQYQQEHSVLQEEVDEVRRSLEEDSRSRRELEADVNRYEQEMRRDKEEATRARAAANERLQDKEAEIGKLRNQLMIRSRNAPDESELESRLKQLTEALIQKQTLVETLSTEKSSLVLQLERAEGQIKRLSQENSIQMQAATSDGGESAGGHSHHRSANMFAFSSGSEQGVVGHVRKAATAVDRFSVRLGVFLRRYPIARLFVILYMGLLHVWVMIVLLTYTPEIHGNDYHRKLPDRNLEHQAAHGLPNDE